LANQYDIKISTEAETSGLEDIKQGLLDLQSIADDLSANISSSLSDIDGSAVDEVSDGAENASGSLDNMAGSAGDAAESVSSIDPSNTEAAGDAAGEAADKYGQMSDEADNASDATDAVGAAASALGASAVGGAMYDAANAAGEYGDSYTRLGLVMGGTAKTASNVGHSLDSVISSTADATGRKSSDIRNHFINMSIAGVTGSKNLSDSFKAVSAASFVTGNSIEATDSMMQRMVLSGNVSARGLTKLGLSTQDMANVMGVSVDQVSDKFKSMDANSRTAMINMAINAKYGSDAGEAFKNSWAGVQTSFEKALGYVERIAGGLILPVLVPAMQLLGNILNSIAGGVEGLPAPLQAIASAATVGAGGIVALGLGINAISKVVGFVTEGFSKMKKAIEAIKNVNIKDLKTKLDNIKKSADDLKKSLSQVFSNIKDTLSTKVQTIKAKLESLKKTASDLKQSLKDVFSNIKDSLSSKIESVKAKLNQLKSAASSAKTTLKEVLSSVKDNLSSKLQTIKSALSGLKTSAIEAATSLKELAVAQLKSAAASAKAAAAYLAEKIQMAAKAVWQGVQTAATYAAAAAQALLNIVMSMNPIAIVIIAIVALVAILLYLYTHNKKVHDAIQKVWQVMQKLGQIIQTKLINVIKILVNLWNTLRNAINNFVGSTQAKINAWVNKVRNSFNAFVATIKQLPAKVWAGLLGVVQRIVSFGSTAVSTVGSIASNILSTFANGLSQLASTVYNEFMKIVDKIKEAGQSIIAAAASVGSDMVSAFFNAIGYHSPMLIRRVVTSEFEKTADVIPDSQSIATRNAKVYGESIVKGFGNPALSTNAIGMKGLENVLGQGQNANNRILGSTEVNTTNNTNNDNKERPITINIAGDVDSEDRVKKIVEAVRKALAFDNKTAGRTS
jgi:phage-related protein